MENVKSETPATGNKGLKKDAIGFVDGVVIALNSTAPAYSLAAVIGLVVVTVGAQAPAALFVSFIPMFFVATAFYYMNRADQDCGTTFSWVTRAMGPWAGWMGGWAIGVTGILVIGSLADVAARYTYLLFGLDGAAGSKAAITVLAVVYIVVMTAICVLGTELSARVQNVLIIAQVGTLLLFAAVALFRVYGGTAPDSSILPELSWFSPFAVSSREALVSGLLIGVFIYWGWESAVNLNEETENSVTAPGLAAVVSTVLLLATYLSATVAVVAFAGLGTVEAFADDDAILNTVATGVLGSPWYLLVVLAVLTSALASTQTTIIPAARTTLSMARAWALPAALGKVHPRFLTPHVSTIIVSVLATIWYVPVNIASENFLFDTLSALSLVIAFYYALTGYACAIYYRKELLKSVKNFLFIGVAPVIGSTLLAYLFVISLIELADPSASYTGARVFGFGLPLVAGLGFLLIGAVLMVLWRLFGPRHERFFSRRPETVDPDVAAGRVEAPETAGAPPDER
ncbi:MAG: APC family permease [Rubrobacteraceae bacterium]